jgi:lauroyl/myristoyl acyltransferase
MAGHRVAWIAGRRTAPEVWPPELRSVCEDPRETGSRAKDKPSLLRALYHARRLLGSGESVFITADGTGGATVIEMPLLGESDGVRQGWLFLREITSAPVLPVLSHMEGRVQVVTVHPPLPPRSADPVRDIEICRERLSALLADHVRRFPEQCYRLAFPRQSDRDDADAA